METQTYPTKQCKSCGASIIWTTTSAGRHMPVDADPVENGNIVLRQAGGEVMANVLRPWLRVEGERYHKTHFATCPQAPHHRRKQA